jgi:hypothetical protein
MGRWADSISLSPRPRVTPSPRLSISPSRVFRSHLITAAFPYFEFAVIMPPLVTTPWTFKAYRFSGNFIVKKPIV